MSDAFQKRLPNSTDKTDETPMQAPSSTEIQRNAPAEALTKPTKPRNQGEPMSERDAEINRRNAEFWAGHNARLAAKMDAITAAQAALIAAIQDWTSDEAFGADKAAMDRACEVVAAPLDALRLAISRRQKDAAKRKRPKKQPSNKSEVVEAMRLFRVSGGTLDAFIDAAEVGSIADVSFTAAKRRGLPDRWNVLCDQVTYPETTPAGAITARGTMAGWWREAGRESTTD
ncbi:hypothetical protein [Sphaerotilus sp.]|uniref:hypothetical protein n=1 Tax=Sphaerotilus sp. TaxID=2093942 RepID=UPI00286E67EF|nr:hypothetical protein [Sphaerotilus sp.]